MTALIADPVPALPVLPPRTVGPAAGRLRADSLGRRPAAWAHVPIGVHADALADVIALRPARSASELAPARYRWTDRGIAVLVTLVGLVFAVLLGTIVSVFLAVDDSPLPTGAFAALSAPAVVAAAR